MQPGAEPQENDAMKTMHRARGRRTRPRKAQADGPTWEVAVLFPNQGQWSEADYLALETNHLIELCDGRLEVLPMPTTSHQWIVLYLYELLKAFAYPNVGLVLTAPLRVRLWPKKFREPDVIFMLKAHLGRVHEDYWEGADLAMEVVSDDPESRKRDLEEKPLDYARAGISEYWIVDPKLQQITVLVLRGKKYSVAGEYKKDAEAVSRLLPGFSVQVASVFAKP
jgi:Uma2 family endonuclease